MLPAAPVIRTRFFVAVIWGMLLFVLPDIQSRVAAGRSSPPPSRYSRAGNLSALREHALDLSRCVGEHRVRLRERVRIRGGEDDAVQVVLNAVFHLPKRGIDRGEERVRLLRAEM